VTYVKKEGGIQNALAWTLYDIREKNYMHFNVTGPVPFPTISRLLHKAHENGEEYALERIQALQNDIKQCCSNCEKEASQTCSLKTCTSCKAVSYSLPHMTARRSTSSPSKSPFAPPKMTTLRLNDAYRTVLSVVWRQ
jgi:hypothetical protein